MPATIVGALILAAVLLSIPVAAVLGVLSISLDAVLNDGRLANTFGGFVWDKSTEFILVAIPLFILLGEIVLRSGIAEDMYRAIAKWLGWLPGGLMHANIGSSAVFAATSGSSVATAATIGTVAYPEITRRGYAEPLFLGSIAAGGTLGILIPPSVPLIVYGVLTQTSIPELYLAGLIPGLLLAALFSGAIVVACIVRPHLAGEPVRASAAEMIRALPQVLPPLILFLGVVGSIYAGWATPTEAAAIGVVIALVLAASRGKLTIAMLTAAFEGTIRTTSMVMLIILAAMILNVVIGFLGIIQAIVDFIGDLGLTPLETMLLVVVCYVILGLFMETFSMMLTTIGIVYPVLTALGFDGVWLGVVIMLLMETALVTPPIGLNLFVVQGIRKRGGPFRDVCVGALPFAVMMLAMVGLLIWLPGIALWLPGQFY